MYQDKSIKIKALESGILAKMGLASWESRNWASCKNLNLFKDLSQSLRKRLGKRYSVFLKEEFYMSLFVLGSCSGERRLSMRNQSQNTQIRSTSMGMKAQSYSFVVWKLPIRETHLGLVTFLDINTKPNGTLMQEKAHRTSTKMIATNNELIAPSFYGHRSKWGESSNVKSSVKQTIIKEMEKNEMFEIKRSLKI